MSRITGARQQLARRFRRLTLSARGLTEADRILTATTPDERDMLFRLARRRAGGIGVELGSAYGASSCFIAAGIRPRGGRLYCVDQWMVEYRIEGSEVASYMHRDDGTAVRYEWDEEAQRVAFDTAVRPGECTAFERFHENVARFSDVITAVRADSAQAAERFPPGVDFLFVDAWHEYEAVRSDVTAWMPKLAPGAIVVFHDIGWAIGVRQVIDELVLPRSRSHEQMPNMFWAELS